MSIKHRNSAALAARHLHISTLVRVIVQRAKFNGPHAPTENESGTQRNDWLNQVELISTRQP